MNDHGSAEEDNQKQKNYFYMNKPAGKGDNDNVR